MTNLQIAELLRNVASAYQLQDQVKNKFKIVAYERAADAVEHATSELKDIWDEGKLEDVPGVGPSIAKHLSELFLRGRSVHFDELMKDIPKDAFRLMKLPNIGIKTAMKLLKESSKEEIEMRIKEVEKLEKQEKRHLLPYASLIASEIIKYMGENTDVEKIEPLGSLRRKVATVGDIDIIVTSKNSQSVNSIMDHFTKYPKTQKVIEKGPHTSSILIPGGIQVDLLVIDGKQYGSAVQHFTGSKHHNIALREHALKMGFSLNEYGAKKAGEDPKNAKYKMFDNENDYYNFLGLQYIPPELREGVGEIEAALRQAQGKPNGLPKLIELQDINGDLQMHSSFDIETSHDVGASSIQELVDKAKELGYDYIALTEHNPSKSGHTPEQVINLLKRKKQTVSEKDWGIHVFNSLEIDINKDGSLPVPEEGMETLDFALVSIHSVFDLPRFDQTRRVLNALSHPKAKIFAHPTARKIQEREGVDLDWDRIFDFCLKNDKWIEINCDPMRLDLPDNLVREAVKLGVKLTLGTDAHHLDGLNNMIWGVNVARRGWCEAKNIINSLSLKELKLSF